METSFSLELLSRASPAREFLEPIDLGRIWANVIIVIALEERTRLALDLSSSGNRLAFEFLCFGRICMCAFFDPRGTKARYKIHRNLLKPVKGWIYCFGVGWGRQSDLILVLFIDWAVFLWGFFPSLRQMRFSWTSRQRNSVLRTALVLVLPWTFFPGTYLNLFRDNFSITNRHILNTLNCVWHCAKHCLENGAVNLGKPAHCL